MVWWRPDDILDLGDITAARATEMTLAIWLRFWAVVGNGHFNFNIVTGSS